MTYQTKFRIRAAMLIVGFVLLLLLPLLLWGAPTPTPFDPSKIDMSQISKADILKTMQHRDALYKEQQGKFNEQQQQIVSQDAALVKVTNALADATKENGILQKKVQDQTDKLNADEQSMAKMSKALWWYRLHWWGAWIMLGLGVLACIILAFLKVSGRLAMKAAI